MRTLLLISLLSLFISLKLNAVTITGSKLWTDQTILSTDPVVLDPSATLTINSATASCLSVQLGANSTVIFNNGSVLTVTNSFAFHRNTISYLDMTNGGYLKCYSLIGNDGSLTYGTGTIEITGNLGTTTDTSYAFSSASCRSFYHLILNNSVTSSVYTTGTPTYTVYGNLTKNGSGSSTFAVCLLNITGNLNVNAGTLTFSGAATKNVIGNLNLAGGTLANTISTTADSLKLVGNLNLTGGTYSSTGILNVGGNLNASSGTNTISNSGNFTIAGTSQIDGTMSWTNTGGTKKLSGDVSISSTGNWVCTGARPFTFGGSLDIDGSITPNTGLYTFSNASCSITGSTVSPAIGGLAVSTGASLTLNCDNTLSVKGTLAAGAGTLTLAASKTLIFESSTSAFTGTANFNNANSKVILRGADGSITVEPATYYELEIDRDTDADANGTATFQTGNTIVTTNLTITSGTAALGSGTVTVSGNTIISDNALLTSAGANTKTFTGDFTVGNGSTVTISSTGSQVFSGNITNNGTWTNTSTGTTTLSGTSKVISGNEVQFYNCTVSGSYTNNGTVTVKNNFTGSGTPSFTQGSNSTLNVKGGTTFAIGTTITTFDASSNVNTINYSRSTGTPTQTVRAVNYHHLTISDRAGIVTFASGTIGIKGDFTDNLTSSTYSVGTGTVSFSGTNSSILGSGTGTSFYNLTIASGSLTGKSDTTFIGNNFTNDGTYNHNSGILKFNKASGTQTISGSGTTNLYDVVVSHATSGGVTFSSGIYNLYHSLDVVSNTTALALGSNLITLKSTGLTNDESARIGDLTSISTFSGSVNWERYFSGNTTWRQLGCPIAGKTLADWEDGTNFYMTGFGSQPSAGGFVSIYYYDETAAATYNVFDSGWVAPSALADPISFGDFGGKGYTAYVGGTSDLTPMTPFTLSMTGNIYTGNQPLTLSNGNPGMGYASSNTGYHVIANPYPSQIDIAASGWTGIDGYYSIDPATSNYDFYDLNSQIQSGTATGIVAQGQAIMLYTDVDANSITFTEAMKTSASGTENFLKSIKKGEDLEIKLTSVKSNFSDRTKIMFANNSSTKYEYGSGDARKINSPDTRAPRLATYSTDGKRLLHNQYSDLTNSFVIPLEIYTPTAGSYNLSGKGLYANGNCLILLDKNTGIETDLTKEFNYTFNSDNKKTYDNRFVIINKTCGTSNTNIQSEAFLKVNQNLNNLEVNLVANNHAFGNLSLISVNGQTIYQKDNCNFNEVELINTMGLTPGIYIVKYVNNEQLFTEKIVIK